MCFHNTYHVIERACSQTSYFMVKALLFLDQSKPPLWSYLMRKCFDSKVIVRKKRFAIGPMLVNKLAKYNSNIYLDFDYKYHIKFTVKAFLDLFVKNQLDQFHDEILCLLKCLALQDKLFFMVAKWWSSLFRNSWVCFLISHSR